MGAAIARKRHDEIGNDGSNVAFGSSARYTAGMPRKKREPGQLGFKDAAEFMGVSETTFYRLVQKGIVKKHKPAYGWAYYLESELRQALDERLAEIAQEDPNRTASDG